MQPWEDIRHIVEYSFAGLLGLVTWLGQRAVKRIDSTQQDHEARLRAIESLAADIMKRPDVLALYAEQKEELRAKVKELREDHKDLRIETSKKLDYIINRLDGRQHNERKGDS